MGELIEAVTTWQILLLVLLVFGFAPRFVLHLMVQVYPKDSPRRRELLAELDAVPRWERPLFVAEQLATVLVDGLPQRAKAIAENRRQRRSLRDASGTPKDPEHDYETGYSDPLVFVSVDDVRHALGPRADELMATAGVDVDELIRLINTETAILPVIPDEFSVEKP